MPLLDRFWLIFDDFPTFQLSCFTVHSFLKIEKFQIRQFEAQIQYFMTFYSTLLHHRHPEASQDPYHCLHCRQVLQGENSILIVALWEMPTIAEVYRRFPKNYSKVDGNKMSKNLVQQINILWCRQRGYPKGGRKSSKLGIVRLSASVSHYQL